MNEMVSQVPFAEINSSRLHPATVRIPNHFSIEDSAEKIPSNRGIIYVPVTPIASADYFSPHSTRDEVAISRIPAIVAMPRDNPTTGQKIRDFIAKYTPGFVRTPEGIRFRQVSSVHGRDLQRLGEEKNTDIISLVWDGDFPYASDELKGVRLDDLHLDYDPNMRQGVKVNGGAFLPLLQSNIKQAALIRRLGIAGERVAMVYKIDKLPRKGRFMPVKDVLTKLFNSTLIRDLHSKEENEQNSFKQLKKSEKTMLARSYIETVSLGAIKRYGGSPWRLKDISIEQEEGRGDRKMLLARFAHAFAVTNALLHAKGQPPQFNFLLGENAYESVEYKQYNDEQIMMYLSHYLSNFVGTQVGKMNGAGIVHNFLTMHNIDLVGYLRDFDSLHGKLLGDDEPTRASYNSDYQMSLVSFYYTIRALHKPGQGMRSEIGKGSPDEYKTTDYYYALSALRFTRSYLSERYKKTPTDAECIQFMIEQSREPTKLDHPLLNQSILQDVAGLSIHLALNYDPDFMKRDIIIPELSLSKGDAKRLLQELPNSISSAYAPYRTKDIAYIGDTI